jgi:hypothetical protein
MPTGIRRKSIASRLTKKAGLALASFLLLTATRS